jgi:hypothetical protein
LVYRRLGFLNENRSNRYSQLVGLVEQCEKVDTLDVTFEAVVPVDSNQGAFIGMRF